MDKKIDSNTGSLIHAMVFFGIISWFTIISVIVVCQNAIAGMIAGALLGAIGIATIYWFSGVIAEEIIRLRLRKMDSERD